MKMVMPLLAPAAGVIRPQVIGGALIKAGDLIARLELANPAAQAQARPALPLQACTRLPLPRATRAPECSRFCWHTALYLHGLSSAGLAACACAGPRMEEGSCAEC